MAAETPWVPSPRSAVIIGLVCMVAGVAPILGALDIIPVPLTRGTPVWVGVGVGVLFVLAGAAVINGSAIEEGSARYVVQNILGLAICAVFAAIFGWIGFGPGEREFSTSISLPFYTNERVGDEWLGRAAFGVGALMAVALAAAFIMRIRRRKQEFR